MSHQPAAPLYTEKPHRQYPSRAHSALRSAPNRISGPARSGEEKKSKTEEVTFTLCPRERQCLSINHTNNICVDDIEWPPTRTYIYKYVHKKRVFFRHRHVRLFALVPFICWCSAGVVADDGSDAAALLMMVNRGGSAARVQ